MSSKEIGSILQIVQKLVGHLPKEMDDELRRLIQRAEDGQDPAIEIEIIDLLSPHENIRLWMIEQVNLLSGEKGTTRGFGSLPGWQSSVPASRKWICDKDGCSESLPVIQEDEDPPTCRVHKLAMVRDDQLSKEG